MLDEGEIRRILDQLPRLSIAVVGDFFLDKYLDLDARLTEKSVETGLDAYQVVGVRTSPGAGGTVTNNLSALGVGRIYAVTLVGSDGEGFDLKRQLAARRVDLTHVIESEQCRTPTYTKPMLDDGTVPARELNRLDIKNRRRMPSELVQDVIARLDQVVPQCDAVIVADQVGEAECGVITSAVRRRLAELGESYPGTILFADSRERIGLFSRVVVKPNRTECLRAAGETRSFAAERSAIESAARRLMLQTERPVYCTLGDEGILYVDATRVAHVPGYPVTGPVDIVGAGDSTSAGIVCGLCAGADPLDAAALGNLVASITIQQIGTTGTAAPEQVITRWRAIASSSVPTHGGF